MARLTFRIAALLDRWLQAEVTAESNLLGIIKTLRYAVHCRGGGATWWQVDKALLLISLSLLALSDKTLLLLHWLVGRGGAGGVEHVKGRQVIV